MNRSYGSPFFMLKSYLNMIIIKENGEKERCRKRSVGDTLYWEDCDSG